MWFHLCLCGFVCSSVSLFLCFCASFLQLATPQTTCSLCGRRETRCKWTPSLCHSLISDKKILIMGTAPNSMKEQVLYLSWGNLFLVLFFPRKLKCSLVRKVVLLKCSTSQKHPGLPFKPGTTHSTETHHFFSLSCPSINLQSLEAYSNTVLTSVLLISELFFHPFIYYSLWNEDILFWV